MANSNFTYSYPGVLERFIDCDGSGITKKVIPSMLTNIPLSTFNNLRTQLKLHSRFDFYDHDARQVREHSFGRVFWYLPNGFSRELSYGEEVTEGPITTRILRAPFLDFKRAIVWFHTTKVSLSTHALPARKGMIGVPFAWGKLPKDLYAKVRLIRWTAQVAYFIGRFPSIQPTISPIDLAEGAYNQGKYLVVNWTAMDTAEIMDEETFGDLPYAARAPWIIIDHYSPQGVDLDSPLYIPKKQIFESYFG